MTRPLPRRTNVSPPVAPEFIRRLVRLLAAALRDRGLLQVQSPLALGDASEPEPDVAVVPPGDYAEAHPAEALLVIDVADSSLRKDRVRQRKQPGQVLWPMFVA